MVREIEQVMKLKRLKALESVGELKFKYAAGYDDDEDKYMLIDTPNFRDGIPIGYSTIWINCKDEGAYSQQWDKVKDKNELEYEPKINDNYNGVKH